MKVKQFLSNHFWTDQGSFHAMVKNIAFIPLQQNHSTELRKIDGPAKNQSHRGKQSMLLALTECLRGESHLPACFAESPFT